MCDYIEKKYRIIIKKMMENDRIKKWKMIELRNGNL